MTHTCSEYRLDTGDVYFGHKIAMGHAGPEVKDKNSTLIGDPENPDQNLHERCLAALGAARKPGVGAEITDPNVVRGYCKATNAGACKILADLNKG